ncbi:MAG: c(7)-type cytochrome triheme domain-containing protein [Pseudomonadota bacterium]
MKGKPTPFCLLLLFLLQPSTLSAFWDLPPLPPPHEYGNILINRISETNKVKPVFFSHWSHRIKYSCRVCHLELEFEFSLNGTEITEADNQSGLFCGACHDGKVAFGHTKEHCDKCHSGDPSADRDKFEKLTANLPRTFYGNKVDWVQAVKEEKMKPIYSLVDTKPQSNMNFQEILELKAEWSYVPPAFFPHSAHIRLLDCGNCHPDIFIIEKKGTEHFEMQYILKKKFCGVCHLKIAFPLNDCKRCHPDMQNH